MAFPVGSVLCLYSSYFDPIECKLSMLRGGRNYSEFMAHMLPVFFNLFTKQTHDQEDRLLKPYLAHILQVHDEYLHHLKKRLGADANRIARDYPKTNAADVSLRLIRCCNKILKEIEGDKDKDDWDLLVRKMSIVDIPQPQLDILTRTTEAAFRAWQELISFIQSVGEKPKIYYSPFQAMYQFMAYGSHLSKGYVLLLRNRRRESKGDFDCAIRHLRRVTLDMRKSILITIFKHAPAIPPDIVRAVLRARRSDMRIGYQDPQKNTYI